LLSVVAFKTLTFHKVV